MADKNELARLAGESAAYRQELERALDTWKNVNKELKENKNLVGKAKGELESQLNYLEKTYKTQQNIKNSIKEASNEQKEYLRLRKQIEKEEDKAATKKLADEEKVAKVQQKNAEQLRERVQNLVSDNEEYLDLQYDISKSFGKTTDHAKMLQAALEKTKTISGEFASFVESANDLTQEQRNELVGVAEEFASINKSIVQATVEHKKGIINARQYVRAIDEAQGQWDKVEQKVQDIIDKSDELKDITGKMGQTTTQTAGGAKATAKTFTAKDKAQLSGDAINTMFGTSPEVEGIVSAGANIAEGLATMETGVGGLVAAYGAIKLLGNAKELSAKLNPRPIVDIQRAYEGIEKTLENQISQLKQYAELQAGIPQLKAELDFAETMAKNTAAFNAASKTAFFGSSLGSPKYAKDQLQLAGVTANDIASTMTEMSKTAGSAMMGLGTDVAVFSKKTGIGAGEIGNVINTIRIFDKSGGSEAFSTMESSLSKSAKNGYNLADITGQIANSAEIASEFNMGSYKNILKQVEATRMLGMDMDKVAQAGKSMVLNYKDSIKAEMTLGAILGENVDLSQVRALFAAGRVSEAGALLKSSGLAAKAQGAGLFAVEALKQATGGLDLTQMNAAEYQKGPAKGLTSNAGFLGALASAQKQLTIDNAVISAQYALLTTQKVEMAQIGAEFYSKISEGISGLIAKQQQQKFIGQVKSEIAKTNFGFAGPEGQIGNYNYTQYGFTPSKNMMDYPRIQQTGYIQPPGYGGSIGMSVGMNGIQVAQNGLSSKDIERQINIAKAMVDPNRLKSGGDTFEDYVKKYNVSNEERVAAGKLTNDRQIGKGLNIDAVNLLKATGGVPSSGGVTAVTTTTAANDKTLKVNEDSYKTLQTIDTSTSATTALLKNIEILQGMMVNLTNPEFNLILDGKDITKAVTQRVVNQTGTSKDPTLRVRGFQ